MSNNNFLCSSCLSVMCSDCKEIASEYDELLRLRNGRIFELSLELEKVKRELASSNRLRDEFEKIAKIGLPGIIQNWIDSQIGEGSENRLRRAEAILRDVVSLRGGVRLPTILSNRVIDEAAAWLAGIPEGEEKSS